jgi:hypothetical protein
LSNILSLNICWQLGDEQLLSALQAFITIAKQAMPFGDSVLLNKATAISVVLYRLICWRLGNEQLLSVHELLLLSLNIAW